VRQHLPGDSRGRLTSPGKAFRHALQLQSTARCYGVGLLREKGVLVVEFQLEAPSSQPHVQHHPATWELYITPTTHRATAIAKVAICNRALGFRKDFCLLHILKENFSSRNDSFFEHEVMEE